jgi:hypothetical protein
MADFNKRTLQVAIAKLRGQQLADFGGATLFGWSYHCTVLIPLWQAMSGLRLLHRLPSKKLGYFLFLFVGHRTVAWRCDVYTPAVKDESLPRDWRVIARELAKETNPNKIKELQRELNRAMEQREEEKDKGDWPRRASWIRWIWENGDAIRCLELAKGDSV